MLELQVNRWFAIVWFHSVRNVPLTSRASNQKRELHLAGEDGTRRSAAIAGFVF